MGAGRSGSWCRIAEGEDDDAAATGAERRCRVECRARCGEMQVPEGNANNSPESPMRAERVEPLGAAGRSFEGALRLVFVCSAQ